MFHPLRIAAVAIGLLLTNTAVAQDPVVRIEEDWELEVKLPEHELTSPQIITAFSPLGDLAGLYATFEVNHISSVDFSSGGLHLSTWCGDTHLAVVHEGNFASMYTDGEIVRWTQAIEVVDGNLRFEVTGGTSTTWGNFGGNGALRLELPTTLENLDAYSPITSINKSEVSYAANRVRDLSMKRVRYIRASGQTTTENAQRYVHHSED